MTKADLTKQPGQVATMFDEVAANYDLTNTLLSLGNSVLWRISTRRAIDPQPGERILDVAAGTGTSSVGLTHSGASVVAVDFSPGMIEVGRHRRANNPRIEFVKADANALPFATASFDVVTISFGLRNVAWPNGALVEFYRVLKPGGRIVICEFSTPPVPWIRASYHAYLTHVLPIVASLASSNPAAYSYLRDSIASWPDQPTLSYWLREAGFTRVAYRNLTEGVVALHRGVKPPAGSTASDMSVFPIASV